MKQKLNDSAVLRWNVLALITFTMLYDHFFTDVMFPLRSVLGKELPWDSLDYGLFTSAYSRSNIFPLMLIFGGIILDKTGIRFTGVGVCLLMVFGCGLRYHAIATIFPGDAMPFEPKIQVTLATLGYAIFGVGAEIAGVTISKTIVKWFKGKEMALAMGLEMVTARIGTTLAMVLTVPLADLFGSTDESGVFHTNISAPILFCLVTLCVGTIAFFIYTFYDKKPDASLDAEGLGPEEPFYMKDIVYIATNKGFWPIALLCVLLYSTVFPFTKYVADLMVQKYDVNPKLTGTIPGLPPIGVIILAPSFGSLYDHVGKGATLVVIGSMILIFVRTMLALSILNIWWFTTVIMTILGFIFLLIPSAMRPSAPRTIPKRQLGTAYALIFWIQNWRLMGVPLLIGWVLNSYCKGPVVDGVQTYDYALPMAIFAVFGVFALVVVLILKAENKKKGCGLEEANIQK